jgi:hypothetical protein
LTALVQARKTSKLSTLFWIKVWQFICPLNPHDFHVISIEANAPILNAVVTAIVDRSPAEPLEIELRDNGAGKDINKTIHFTFAEFFYRC